MCAHGSVMISRYAMIMVWGHEKWTISSIELTKCRCWTSPTDVTLSRMLKGDERSLPCGAEDPVQTIVQVFILTAADVRRDHKSVNEKLNEIWMIKRGRNEFGLLMEWNGMECVSLAYIPYCTTNSNFMKSSDHIEKKLGFKMDSEISRMSIFNLFARSQPCDLMTVRWKCNPIPVQQLVQFEYSEMRS